MREWSLYDRQNCHMDRRRERAGQLWQDLFQAVNRLNNVRTGLALNVEEHCRFLAFLLPDPRAELIVFNAVDHIREIAQPNRRAIFVGDDDWFVCVGREDLVV